MSFLQGLTEEEREAIREKAKAARLEKKAAGENLKNDFSDEAHWRALASKYGIRLPTSYIPNSETKYVKRVAAKLGVDLKEYLDGCGVATLKKLVQLNPEWPAYAEVSMMIEWWDEKQNDQ